RGCRRHYYGPAPQHHGESHRPRRALDVALQQVFPAAHRLAAGAQSEATILGDLKRRTRKSEIRISKSETISKFEKENEDSLAELGFVWNFLLGDFGFVSDFDIRISDL